MNTYTIIPRDPLIFGDGKSYSAAPGERSQSMPFPFPATLAGAVRTLAGTDAQTGKFDEAKISALKQMAVHGPILAQLDMNGSITDWLFPAPADALLVEEGGQVKRYSLGPGSLPADSATNLDGLNLMFPNQVVRHKVSSNAPRFWRWQAMKDWLNAASDGVVNPDTLGIKGLTREIRTHVRIDPQTKTGQDGMLFQTSGMEFLLTEQGQQKRWKQVLQLALAARTNASLNEGWGSIGGERRVARWQVSGQGFPACPVEIKQKIVQQKHCRLVLATPAVFAQGYLPAWLLQAFGAKAAVRAAACARYQTVSGWDYERKKPKPTRRLVPAGSVYFLRLEGSEADIEKFVDAVWLNPVSDAEQDRLDGFGLALLGTWDGNLREVK